METKDGRRKGAEINESITGRRAPKCFLARLRKLYFLFGEFMIKIEIAIGAIHNEMSLQTYPQPPWALSLGANALGTRLVSHAQRDFLAAERKRAKKKQKQVILRLNGGLKIARKGRNRKGGGGLYSLNSLWALLVGVKGQN